MIKKYQALTYTLCMKKMVLILGVVVIVATAFWIIWRQNQQQVVEYSLSGIKKKFLVAKTAEEWEKGLMDYRQLDEVDGMIFVFPQAELRTFWNKNTYLDLQIYWLRNHQIIGQSFLPSIERSKEYIYIRSPGPVDTVIEEVKK